MELENWIKEEIKGDIKRYIKTNENKHTSYQNYWDALKAVLRGKYGYRPILRNGKNPKQTT